MRNTVSQRLIPAILPKGVIFGMFLTEERKVTVLTGISQTLGETRGERDIILRDLSPKK